MPLRFSSRSDDGLGAIGDRLGRLRPILERVGDVMRESIREEFASEEWLRPQGGRSRWEEPTDREPRTLRDSGKLLEGWTALSSQKITGDTVTIENPVEYAGVHRPTSGGDVSDRDTFIRAQRMGAKGLPSMFWVLGMEFGIWTDPEELLREGVRIPARPHATKNPRLIERVNEVVREAIFS